MGTPPAPVALEEDSERHITPGIARPPEAISRPDTVDRRRVLWPYALAVVAYHLLLPLAFVPWLFSWTGLLLIPLGNYVFCSLAWRLRAEGHEAPRLVPAQEAGNKWHLMHGSEVARSRRSHFMALIFTVSGVVSVLLLILYFMSK